MRPASAALLNHMAQENTTLATCYRLTLTQQQPIIIGISKAAVAEVTTKYDHSLIDGSIVSLYGVLGMIQVTGNYYTVTVTGTNTFTIGVDSTGFSTYTSGGEARQTYGFCNIDEDIIYLGVTYHAAEGSVPSTIRINNNNVINDVEMLSTYVAQFTIKEDDIHAGKIDFAEAQSFIVNYKDLSMGHMIMITGHTGETKLNRGSYVNAVASLSDILAKDTIRVVTPDCQHDLGDSECQVDLVALTVSGTVTSVANRRQFNDTSRSEALQYFRNGLVTWTSGDNVGTQIEVQSFNTSNIKIFEDVVFDIQVGDTYLISPGCDKSKLTCINEFNNIVNFNGFDFLPGPAELSNVGNKRATSD